MNTRTLLASTCGLAAALTAQADWTLVSSFDDSSALSLITDSINIEGSNARSEIIDGKWATLPGDLFQQTSNLYALLDMGTDLRAASIAAGGPITVFIEVSQPIVPDGMGGTRKAIVDTVWGPSNFPPSEILSTRFNSNNAMQRVNSGNDSFESRNGSAYEIYEPFQGGVTYKIWFVIDFVLNYYESYIQGGQWATQTRLPTAATEGYFSFRVNPGPDTVVRYFLVALSRGNTVDGEKGIDPTYFDNLYYDATGINLNDPAGGGCTAGPGIFADYCVSDGWVNTGAYMGNVYVMHYPWAYVQDLGRYVYIGWGDNSGSWMFLNK